MRWFPHFTVATVVERDGCFLMVEEDKGAGPVYNQPAGHLEDGETLLDAAHRETLEETAWTIDVTALVGLYQWRHPTSHQTFVRACFAAEALCHDPARALDRGILRALWLTRAGLVARSTQLRSPLVMRCLDDYLAGCRYPLDVLKPL